MITKRRIIEVQGVPVEVVWKDIKNLHLGVYPPNGRIRVAAPVRFDEAAVRLIVVSKLPWIRRHQRTFAHQERQSKRDMVDGETHYFLGRRHRLRVHEQNGPARVALRGVTTLDLYVRPDATAEQRESVLQRWYREQLRVLVPSLLEKWQPKLGVVPTRWGIKKMKTRWGSCNTEAKRLWFNLELAKKPVQCVEYVVVHELAHILERRHNDRFTAIMDSVMPAWRRHRDELNRAPLAHETWDY